MLRNELGVLRATSLVLAGIEDSSVPMRGGNEPKALNVYRIQNQRCERRYKLIHDVDLLDE